MTDFNFNVQKIPAKQVSTDETNLDIINGETAQEVFESIDSNFTTVQVNSATWGDGSDLTELAAASGGWNSTQTTVNSNSAAWDSHSDLTELAAASGGWNSTETTVGANSGNWDSAWQTVSGGVAADLGDIPELSGNWNSTHTTVNDNSGNWDSAWQLVSGGVSIDLGDIPELSGNWNSTYTTVSTNSGNWDSAYTITSGATYIPADTLQVDYTPASYIAITPDISGHFNGMDSIIAAASGLGASIQTTSTITTATSTVTDFSLNISKDVIDVVRGRLYVNNTDVTPFSDTLTLTFYTSSARRGDSAIFKADMPIIVDTMPSTVTGGSTIPSNDSSGFSASDLVYLSGSSGDEFARIQSVSSTDLIMEDVLENNYNIGALISLTPEFGGFTLYDANASQTLWARGLITGSDIIDTSVWLEYK